MVGQLLAPYKEALAAQDIALKEGAVLSLISRAKAKGLSPDDLLTQSATQTPNPNPNPRAKGSEPTTADAVIAHVYAAYETALRASNALDFDDMLVFGVRLFGTHAHARAWCGHVLVDELCASFYFYAVRISDDLGLQSGYERDAVSADAAHRLCERMCYYRRRPGSVECVRSPAF
jgi:hypothetical protein